MDKISAFMLILAFGYVAFVAACIAAYLLVGYKIPLWIFLISWIIIGVILFIGILVIGFFFIILFYDKIFTR